MRAVLRRLLTPDVLIGAGLFLLPLAFFWQVTLGGKTLLPADNLYQFQPWATYRDQLGVPEVPHNGLLSDLVLENLVWKTFIRESIQNRELPLWNPYSFAGAPFLAAGQHSALYPFSLLYYVLPLDKAYGWFTVSQLWLAGLLMYCLARGLGVGCFGATVSAVGYQMSSFFLASVVFQMIIAAAAWLPFLLLMVEFTIRQRPLLGRPTVIPWVALGVVGLGIENLAGHVEFTYYALLVMGFWAACRLGLLLWQMARARTLRERWRGMLLKPAAALVVLVTLGMAAGAVQFVPLLEVAGRNFREGSASFTEVRGYAYPPRHALAFFMPNLYGSPAQHEYFDVFTGSTQPFRWQRTDGSTVTDTFWQVGKNYVEGACYVGLLTLLLALIALLNAAFEKSSAARLETAGPYRGILLVLSILSVLFIFGTPAYAILYYGLPGFSQLHSPFRWVFPLTICLTVLAGFGAEAVQRVAADPDRARSFTRRAIGYVGYGSLALGLVIAAGLGISRVLFAQLRGPIEALYHNLAGAPQAFPNAETFYSVSVGPLLLFAVFLLLSGLALILSRSRIALPQRFGGIAIWQIVVIVVLAADLIVASAGFNPAADPKWLAFEPPAVTWLKQQNPRQWRFVAVEGATKTMNANTGWLYGLQDIAGYDSIIPKQYADYMRQIQPQGMLIYNRIAPLFANNLEPINSPALDLLGVKYIVSEAEIDTAKFPKLKLAYQDQAVRIYENQKAAPFLSGGELDTAKRSNIEIIFHIKNTQSSPLAVTLHQSHFPGWRAYVRPLNGREDQEREIPIALADGNFQQVQVEPGEWSVRLRYSPQAFQIGAYASFIAGVITLFALLIWLWRHFYTEGDSDSAGVRRFAKNSIAPIVMNLFNKGIDFAFAAIMLRVLGPGDSGSYYYAVVIFGWFDTLTNFGLNLLLTREVSRNRGAASRYLINSSVLRLLLAGVGVFGLAVFLLIQNAITPMNPLSFWAILLLYVGLFPNTISYGMTALCYAFEKAEIPAAITTVSVILKAVLGVAALIAGWGVIGLAAMSIIINVITLAILSFQARALLHSHPQTESSQVDRGLIRQMVFTSWPLMLNNLLASLFFKIDVTLLEPMKGSTAVGQYSAAYKWADALGIVPSLFTAALLPIMSRQAAEDKAAMERTYHFAVKLMFSLALPVAIVTMFLAEFLVGLLGGARFLPDGAIALQLMIWFIPLGWINSLTNYVLIALDQQRPMRWAFAAGVGFNVIANLLFIPLYSYKAAAVITIFSEVVLLIGFYWLLRKALAPINWIGLLWKPTAAGLLMLIVMGVIMAILPRFPILAAAVGVTVYPTVLAVLRPFWGWELDRLTVLLPGRVRGVMQLYRSLARAE